MRRNAASQIEKPREPLAFRLAELGNGDKIVGPADDRAHGDHHDVDQRISHLAAAGIGKVGEVILNPGGLHLGHGMNSWADRDFHALAAPQQAAEIAIAQSYQITQMAQSPRMLAKFTSVTKSTFSPTSRPL